MPKFKVLFEQWAQEYATLEVEAATAEEAHAKAEQMVEEGEYLDWSDGSDMDYHGIVEVTPEEDDEPRPAKAFNPNLSQHLFGDA